MTSSWMQDLPAQPPQPWTLTESPGDSQLLLMRQYNDETIEVRVIADEVRRRGELTFQLKQPVPLAHTCHQVHSTQHTAHSTHVTKCTHNCSVQSGNCTAFC